MASGTPFAQVRIPVRDLIFPPPPTSAHTILLGRKIIRWRKNYPAAAKICAGRIIIRRRNNYPAAGAGGPEIRKKNPKIVAQCRKYPFVIHCETIPYPYTLPKTLS